MLFMLYFWYFVFEPLRISIFKALFEDKINKKDSDRRKKEDIYGV